MEKPPKVQRQEEHSKQYSSGSIWETHEGHFTVGKTPQG